MTSTRDLNLFSLSEIEITRAKTPIVNTSSAVGFSISPSFWETIKINESLFSLATLIALMEKSLPASTLERGYRLI